MIGNLLDLLIISQAQGNPLYCDADMSYKLEAGEGRRLQIMPHSCLNKLANNCFALPLFNFFTIGQKLHFLDL